LSIQSGASALQDRVCSAAVIFYGIRAFLYTEHYSEYIEGLKLPAEDFAVNKSFERELRWPVNDGHSRLRRPADVRRYLQTLPETGSQDANGGSVEAVRR
jgi:hypothetical protein